MLVPGSKGWINKYFDLVEKDQIKLRYDLPCDIDNNACIRAAMSHSGILFGYPSDLIFAFDQDDSTWTTEEKLKLLLFESMLFVYKLDLVDNAFVKEEFINALIDFYGQNNTSSKTKIYSFLLRESKEEKIESILSKRVDIKVNYLENRFWVNYLNNVFLYLDVILFHKFLTNRGKSTLLYYDEMAMNALTAITIATHSDGKIEEKEKSLFSVFLASANLSDLHRQICQDRFDNGAEFSDFTEIVKKNELLSYFILDLSTFVIFSNHDALPEEKSYLQNLSLELGFKEYSLNESYAITEHFILTNLDKIPFLKSSSSVEKVYSNLSIRWIKILGRNRDKLIVELKQSKELLSLIRKSTTTELSKEEKETVKFQFKEIVKSMPSLAIFMLPGGALLLPLVLKVIPALLPTAFRDNEVEK